MDYSRHYARRSTNLLLGFVVALGISLPVRGNEVIDRTVAIVNNKVILLTELTDKALRVSAEMKRQKPSETLPEGPDLKARVLDQLINEVLVAAEIEQKGLAASDSVIDSAMQTVMRQNRIETLADFRKVLKEEGLTLEEYRQSLKHQIEESRLMNDVIRPRVHITDRDIGAEFQRRSGQSANTMTYRLRMIFKKRAGRDVRLQMEKFRESIVGGESFETVAGRETEGAGKGEGGDLGEVKLADLQPELAKAASALEVGGMSPVLETPLGFYLIKNVAAISAETAIDPKVKDQIRDELTTVETARQFDAFVRSLRDKAHIQIQL